jgi:hypothetical protein
MYGKPIENYTEKDCRPPDSARARAEAEMDDRHEGQSREPDGEQPILVSNEAQHVLAFHPDQHLTDVTKIAEIEKADYE